MAMRKPTRKVSPESSTVWNMAHQNMLATVSIWALSSEQAAITASVPAFESLMMGIQANLVTVKALRTIARSPITGYAAQKNSARESLIAFSVNVMHATFSYAVNAGNALLAEQTAVSTSELEDGMYAIMLERVQSAIADITPFAADGSLAAYNVTSATMTAWQALKDAAEITLTTPESAIANRESINMSIQRLLHDSMVSLTNLGDTLVYQFRDANMDYFNAYWACRRLHEHHVPTQARFYVLDQVLNPVTQGEFFIVGTPASGRLDANGYCFIDHIPFGEHAVTLTTPYGNHNYGPFDFKKGHSLTLHFQINVLSSEPATVKVQEVSVSEVK